MKDEMAFERLPEPSIRRVVRIRTGEGESVVLEVREASHAKGPIAFHRADARVLWTENAYGVRPETRSFAVCENAVQVTVDTVAGTARFGPRGHIIMSVRGCGLGSYLMSQVIAWLKERHPECRVLRGSLASVDAGDENRERRNRFYRKHGFDVELDDQGVGGSFSKDRAGDLVATETRAETVDVDGLVRLYAKAESERRRLANVVEARGGALQERGRQLAAWRSALLGVAAFTAALIAFPGFPAGLNAFLRHWLGG